MSGRLRTLARAQARAHGIDADRFERQMAAESSFRPDAVSPTGAIGVAQIMPATAASWDVDPTDPVASLSAAARAMAAYLEAYGGDWPRALAAYNAGPGAVTRWAGVPPFAETRDYLVKVLGHERSPATSAPAQVALTFNDGPGAATEQLLAVLARHRAKATFFLVGSRIRRHRSLVRRIARAGHEVANHSFGHAEAADPDLVADDIRRASSEIERAVGAAPRLYRPPTWPSRPRELGLAAAAGLTTLGWTLGPKNWTVEEVGRIHRPIASAAVDGSIVLLHDGGPRAAHTPAAVERVLAALGRRGYEFLTATALLRRSPAPPEWAACGSTVLP